MTVTDKNGRVSPDMSMRWHYIVSSILEQWSMFGNLTLLKLGAAIQVTSNNQDRPKKGLKHVFMLSVVPVSFFLLCDNKGR